MKLKDALRVNWLGVLAVAIIISGLLFLAGLCSDWS